MPRKVVHVKGSGLADSKQKMEQAKAAFRPFVKKTDDRHKSEQMKDKK